MNISPIILAKNSNFKKWRHDFVDEKALKRMTLISCCHRETLVVFGLQKKIPENALFSSNGELSQNRTEKQIIPFEATINWLFDDI